MRLVAWIDRGLLEADSDWTGNKFDLLEVAFANYRYICPRIRFRQEQFCLFVGETVTVVTVKVY